MKVLLAEKYQQYRKDFNAFLAQNNLEIIENTNANEIYSLVSAGGIDLLIMNVDIDGGDGWTLSQQLKKSAHSENLTIIGLCYDKLAELRNYAGQFGMETLILSPLDADAKRIIQTVIDSIKAENPQNKNSTNIVAENLDEQQDTMLHDSQDLTQNQSTKDTSSSPEVAQSVSKLQEYSQRLKTLAAELKTEANNLGKDGEEFVGHIIDSSLRTEKKLEADVVAKVGTNAENPFWDKKLRHDFRNLLGTSSGFSQLLIMETDDVNLQEKFEEINNISLAFVEELDKFKTESPVNIA